MYTFVFIMRRIAVVLCCFVFCIAIAGQEKSDFIGAVQKFSDEKYEEARADFELLHARDSLDDAVLYYLGLCEYSMKDIAAAKKHLAGACEIDSTNMWYLGSLASVYSSTGERSKSAKLCEKLVRRNPRMYKNSFTLTMIGDSRLEEGNDSLALSYYGQALEMEPDYAPAELGKSEVYRLRNNLPAYFLSLGNIIGNSSVPASLKSQYIQNIMQNMDSRFYWVWGEQLGKLVDSCVTMHPEDVQSRVNKLQICFIKRDTLGIMQQCREIIPVAKAAGDTSNLMTAYSTLGDFYYHLGEYSRAFETFETALKECPSDATTLNNYAYFLSERGKKLRKALKMSKTAIELEPDNATYLDTYGWILFLMKKYKEAKPYFKHAMIYGGKDSAVILEHYAKVLDALGENNLANYYHTLSKSRVR